MYPTSYLLILTLLTYEVTAISNVTVEEIPETFLSFVEGNSLWTSLIKNCKRPTMACVQESMYDYLQETLDNPSRNLQVDNFLKFTRNNVNYDKIKANDSRDEFGGRSSVEEMSRSLQDKSVKFLMTHDAEVQLPETIFQGAILKLSPRSFDGDGALVKLEFTSKELQAAPEGRLFKKIKKFISEKLVFALLAILLVIKLLAAKFMFFMPMVVGAVAAKKLLIKVLLFLFPALAHLFKLCAYMPHSPKFHHHKHQISHIHHVEHGGHHHHPSHHHGPHESVEVIAPHADGPPSLHEHDGHPSHDGPPWHQPSIHHNIDIEPPHRPLYNPHEQELEYYSGGPALAHHFINHRQDSGEVENEVSWGQGQAPVKKISARPLTPTEIENLILKAEKEALIKTRLEQERQRIHEENTRLQEQLKQSMKMQEKLRQQAAIAKLRLTNVPKTALEPPANHFQAAANHFQAPVVTPSAIHQTQKIFNQEIIQPTRPTQKSFQVVPQQNFKPSVQEKILEKKIQEQNLQSNFEKALNQAATITYDAFYSPILEKIDKILAGLGLNEEACRERLICSMYKNPTKWSPHSNLLSAELSRDSKELQKPVNTNAAVIRFYRYVQAARDGQDKRECLRLYPTCSINTELK